MVTWPQLQRVHYNLVTEIILKKKSLILEKKIVIPCLPNSSKFCRRKHEAMNYIVTFELKRAPRKVNEERRKHRARNFIVSFPLIGHFEVIKYLKTLSFFRQARLDCVLNKCSRTHRVRIAKQLLATLKWWSDVSVEKKPFNCTFTAQVTKLRRP